MKFLLAAVMTLSTSLVFAEATALTIVAPTATVVDLTRTAIVSTAAPFASTAASIQARGVAGKEQIKDEMVALENDVLSGEVTTVEEVRQPALRELFEEIRSDKTQMKSINASLSEGSELEKIATAVASSLN